MVVLARVDQRLIHGLIVNQWAPHLQVKRFMVVDDVLCNNEEIKASMRMAKPAGTGVSVISTETAIANFKAGKYDGQRVFVLVKEPETLIRLMEGGVEIPKVDLGIIFNLSVHAGTRNCDCRICRSILVFYDRNEKSRRGRESSSCYNSG